MTSAAAGRDRSEAVTSANRWRLGASWKASVAHLALLPLALLPSSEAAHASACDPVAVALTTTPVMPQLDGSLHQYLDLMSKLPNGPVDLLLVGDSLVASWEPAAWGTMAKHKSIFNFGVGGDRTQNVLWRLRSDRLAELRPSNILLLVGTNNLAVGDPPCAVLAGIDSIIGRMRVLWRNFRLVIVLIPPRGDNWSFQDAHRREINQGLKQRAAAEGWAIVDLDSALTCHFSQHCGNYQADKLHLTRKGYEVLTPAVIAALGW